ncbi:MAG: diguanylate cyclase [Comamonas sp.]|nr:diguanylate cyclase [Comamonas sp.]
MVGTVNDSNNTHSLRRFSFRRDSRGPIASNAIVAAGVALALAMAAICAVVLYQSQPDAMDHTTDIYALWWHRALIIAAVMGALATACIGLCFAFGGQLRRRMRAEAELAMLARTDGLTGLNNRRTLDEILNQEWRRARRNRSVFSLLFVDIDRFKVYNDTYGHQAGDDALAAVAKCIGENIRRPVDSAARYGGEEFIVVLPDTSPEGAASMAERIRAAIVNLAIEHVGSEHGHVTVSIGAASWTPQWDVDVCAVIRAADEALYSAKATGRDMVALSTAHQANDKLWLDRQAAAPAKAELQPVTVIWQCS